ncbi:SMP-30/gluconolactonase/LRE family protein [Solilutibacter silvestris]|uniref:Gluconolactonase n=1 Tax=Solilutibacter silvestris TaxID=1645665 RepID=A0A2K1Q0H0_9GAMM|nr:SMP-30/gluconolactonase/LRE family protein [Lysobacter silvestris]PNS08540.1 Gluconolactonase [Lysobacter silvestris]
MKLIDVVPVGNLLGEGVQWNPDDGCLWWTDISNSMLHRWHLDSRVHSVFATPERLCSFAFIEGQSRLLCAFASGVAMFDPHSGAITWLHRLETPGSGRRCNDGRVDRQGRFWVGTMVEDAARAGAFSASLYCMDRDGGVHVREREIDIANGLCWSPDGGRMYFADSARRTMYAYDFDGDTGAISARREFARLPESAEPDGACVDAQGCVWSAQWGAGQVACYAPDGRIRATIEVPASQPTCVAFAGASLDLLCVTSARAGLDAAALARQPDAGHLFIYQATTTGLAECRVRADFNPIHAKMDS